MLPVGEAGRYHTVEVCEHFLERLRQFRGGVWESAEHIARFHRLAHRPVTDGAQVLGHPVHHRVAVTAESVQIERGRYARVVDPEGRCDRALGPEGSCIISHSCLQWS